MKKLFLLLILVVISAGIAVQLRNPKTDGDGQLTGSALVGHQAPDFTLASSSGTEMRLSALRGKVVFLNFWATWCPPCRAEMPAMDKLYQQFKEKTFEMLAVNVEVDGPEIIPEFLQEHPHSFPILFDTEEIVRERYGVYKFPETFVIGKDGTVLDHIVGAREWNDQRMVDYFKKLVEGN